MTKEQTFKMISLGISEEIGHNYIRPKRRPTSRNYKGFSLSWHRFRWIAQRRENNKSLLVNIGKSLYDSQEKIDAYLFAKDLERFNATDFIKKWNKEIETVSNYEDSLMFVLMQQRIFLQIASKIYFMRKFSSQTRYYEKELKKLKRQLTKWEWILVGNLLSLGNTFDEIFVALMKEKENAN